MIERRTLLDGTAAASVASVIGGVADGAEKRVASSAFPKDFQWGAATAAYQIEGVHTADGKGESIWDRFVLAPGKIKNGNTGNVACDSYYRFDEDLALMRTMGLKSYRFSSHRPGLPPIPRLARSSRA